MMHDGMIGSGKRRCRDPVIRWGVFDTTSNLFCSNPLVKPENG